LPGAATTALDGDKKRRQDEKDMSGPRLRFESSTPRERQVMNVITAGPMNMQTAAEAGVSETMMKIHRGSTTRMAVDR
jgi:FixJ family two-component response regulator